MQRNSIAPSKRPRFLNSHLISFESGFTHCPELQVGAGPKSRASDGKPMSPISSEFSICTRLDCEELASAQPWKTVRCVPSGALAIRGQSVQLHCPSQFPCHCPLGHQHLSLNFDCAN